MEIKETKSAITKGEKTKKQLFASAAQLFNQYDFDEVTVDKIVEKAGVAKGTFYIHFESKDALIAAFVAEYIRKVDNEYQSVLDSSLLNASATQILLELIGKIADILTENIGYPSMKIVYKLLLSDAAGMSTVKGYDRDLYQVFSNVLTIGLERGEFAFDLPVETVARHLVLAIRGISYEWCIRHPDFDLKASAISHFRLLLDGLKLK